MLIINNIESFLDQNEEKNIRHCQKTDSRICLASTDDEIETDFSFAFVLSSTYNHTLIHIRLIININIIQTVNIGASVRPFNYQHRRRYSICMSSTPTSGRPSFSLNPRKKSSEHRQRATSNEDLARPKIKREASSAFNYQTLTDSTPVNVRRITSKAPVRSHSSSNAEISYHLNQLRNLSKCKGALTASDDQSKKDEKIRLTSSNLKIVCNETGPDSTTVTVQSIETNIELPVSWKPAIQQITIQRDSWDHKIEFLLAVIGYAVDLGNVWRFPTTVYNNGGGAFFIPYFILLIFGGLPLFYMELALGQYHRSGIFTIWKHICPLVKGIGWATVLINFMTAMFYNTIISWAVFYFAMSFQGFRGNLPWKGCENEWNTPCCVPADVGAYEYSSHSANLTYPSKNRSITRCDRIAYSTEEYFYRRVQEVHLTKGFEELGDIKWDLAFCLFIVFFIVYFALWKGIKSSGKAVWITAIAPYAVLFILLIRGVTLKGASEGIRFYLEPKMHLLKKLDIWNEAATQIFFSLGPGFGVLMALSSYNKFHNNCYRDALITSTINCATSILSGFVVFSTLGHMAYVSKKTIEKVIEDRGSELVFIVYPHTIALMNWSTLWAILFFFMVITLGIDSTFGGLESIITGLCDEFPNVFGRHRSLFVLGVLVICFLGALPTCTYGGDYIVSLMNQIAVAPALLLVVFVECIAVSWFYGINRFSLDVKAMIGIRPSLFWRIIWYLISPLFLIIIFYISMKAFLDGGVIIKGKEFSSFPMNVQVWSYLMVFVPILCIPGYAIYKLIITPGKDFDERLQRSIKPEEPLLELIHSRSIGGGHGITEKNELL